LSLRKTRTLHHWGIAEKPSKKIVDYCPAGAISIERLVEAMKNPDNAFSLQALHLSGLILSSASIVALAKALPFLKSGTLLLRDTCLDTVALTAIATALKHNKTLKELDISHNVILDTTLMEVISDSLKENATLRTLKMQHCDMNFELVEILAGALPSMNGLQQLHLDGNDFALGPPLTAMVDDENKGNDDGDDSSSSSDTVAKFPTGPVLLVNDLKHNYHLLDLSMKLLGGPPGTRWGTNCCSAPPYEPWMTPKHLAMLETYQRRNKELDGQRRKTNMQQSLVRFAELMLRKLSVE